MSESTSDCASSSFGLADDLLLEQLLAPAEREFRLLQARLVLGRSLARRRELRFRELERRARLRIVEMREDLPFLDRVAFLDQDVHTLPVTFDETVARRRATT